MRAKTLWAVTAGLLIGLPSLSAAQTYRIAFLSTRNGAAGIHVMESDGSNVKRLTEDKLSLVKGGAWSPDGQRILFYAVRQGDLELLVRYRAPLHYPLYVMDASGAGQKRLLDVPVLPEAKWSPDGKRIVFTSAFEDPDREDPGPGKDGRASAALYVLEVATGAYKRVTRVAETDVLPSPAWSPDGKRVAFTCGKRPERSREICVVDADGTNQKPLTTRRGVAVTPAWSPDGRHVAFGVDGSETGVYVIDQNGADLRRISESRGWNVAWSPDGKRLLTQAARHFCIVDVEQKDCTRLSPGEGRVLDAVFSPDGRDVLFRSNESGKDRIYAIKVDGTGRRILSDGVGEDSLFAVSPLLRTVGEPGRAPIAP